MSQCGNEPLMPRLGLRIGLRHLRWNDDGNFISGNTFYRSIAYNNKLTIITFARLTFTVTKSNLYNSNDHSCDI